MFEFFEEYDKEIYKEIIDEVEFNMWNDRCVSIIQSEVEKIIKKLFKESEIAITNVGADGIVYREYNPTLHRLFRNDEFKKYLHENKILSSEEIDNYQNFKFRNYKEHGPKYNEVLCINEKTKEDSLKFLFKLCYQVYLYKFQKQPNAYWDEMYFKKLLEKPTKEVVVVEKPVEKIVEVEKEKIVERVVDNTELEKVKNEQEDLKKQISQLKSAPSNFNNVNYALLERLEIGNKCLQNKDFANARISFNNCRNLDITRYEAYLGLILCDYAVSSQEELIEKIYPNNTLGENENYQMILRFCSKDNVDKAVSLMESLNKEINVRKTKELREQEILSKLKEVDFDYCSGRDSFRSAFQVFQMHCACKDMESFCNEFIELLEKAYQNNIYLYVKVIKNYIHILYDNQILVNRLKLIVEEFKKFDITCSVFNGKGENVSYFSYRLPTVVINDKTICRHCLSYHEDDVETVILPNDIETIGDSAFDGCKNLKKVKVALTIREARENKCEPLSLSNNSSRSTGDGLFSRCKNLKSIVIPKSVTSIGSFAFNNCINLKSIDIPNSVTKIDLCAFSNCRSLKSIDIPNGVISIGSDAFDNCRSLKSIVIPKGVISIGSFAFNNCINLKSIVIPKSVTNIGYQAFGNWCSSKTIYFEVESALNTWDKYWKIGCDANIVWGYQGKQ